MNRPSGAKRNHGVLAHISIRESYPLDTFSNQGRFKYVIFKFNFTKELYFLTGTETFAKESKLAKLLRELKPTLVSCNKKIHWFLLYVCNGKFAVLGVFFAG